MRLRSQILLTLLLFALTPLIVALAINMPLIYNSLEFFYNQAHLQNLRADFRDLDQHLASRREMTRLLARIPEPGLVLGQRGSADPEQLDNARRLYTTWINSLIGNQFDVFEVQFVDAAGQAQLSVTRDLNSGIFDSAHAPRAAPAGLIESALQLPPGGVLTGRMIIDTDNLSRPGSLHAHLAAPIGAPSNGEFGEGPQRNIGALILTIDVGGLSRVYPGTLWAQNDGSYLTPQNPSEAPRTAFNDFPGLASQFASGEVTLWRGPNQAPMIWVPIFQTENSGPIWVGRQVDPSPIDKIKNDALWRVLGIVALLAIVVLLFARRLAGRVDRLSRELIDGLRKVIESARPVRFNWRRPQEVRELGNALTQLAQEHAEQTESSKAQADALRRSNAVKSRFLANVSHELRTPLNSILLLSKMLAKDPNRLSNDQRQQAATIHTASRDLNGLIDNILTQSRIEAGKTELVCETIQLRPFLEAQLAVLAPQFDARGLPLELALDERLPEAIQSDAGKLAQILKNFLSNALKFTHQGQVKLQALPSDNGIDFTVRDTGIGIGKSKLARIFEPFEQAEGDTNRRYGGTGLGLAISRDLATLLGGSIHVQSEPGSGSAFTFHLPTDAAPASLDSTPSEPPTEPGHQSESEPVADFHGRSLIIADSDAKRLLQLASRLENWHLNVEAAMDSEELFETLAAPAAEPCLILLDIDNDAFDINATMAHLQSLPPTSQLPIMVLSANTEATALDGIGHVLVKPFTAQELLDELTSLLS